MNPTLEQIAAAIGDRPYMKIDQARRAWDIIGPNKLGRILELGHYQGASTCYFAAMARELGGRVTTCDLPQASDYAPNLEHGLAACGLADRVTIHRDAEGAEWRMLRMIDAGAEFDFVYVDAGHNIKCAGLQFFLAERLLRPGGWLVFDDLPWTHRQSGMKDFPWVRRMTEAEQTTAQVGWVWRTLVKPHPQFERHQEAGWWGWCWKRSEPAPVVVQGVGALDHVEDQPAGEPEEQAQRHGQRPAQGRQPAPLGQLAQTGN